MIQSGSRGARLGDGSKLVRPVEALTRAHHGTAVFHPHLHPVAVQFDLVNPLPPGWRAVEVAPLFIAGGVVPPYYLLLIGVALAAAVVLGLGLARTKIGKVIRAAAHNPGMVSALGINTGLIYGGVFALGGMLAGLAGALAAPVRSLTPGMGFSVLIESFIVTVIGGMGSILGALIGAILIGMIRSFGSLGFPLFTEGLMYLFMVIVLVSRPTGLFGKEVA